MTMDKNIDAVKISINVASPEQKTKKIFGITFNQNTLINVLKVLLWLILVLSITFTPIMMRISYFDTKTHAVLKNKYIPSSAHATSFLSSIFIGLILSFFIEGKKSLLECFSIKGILLLSPVSAGYAISELIALTAMSHCAPIMYAAIHKMRLLIAAIMTRIFLRRKLSLLCWIICITVTFTVMAFVMYSIKTGGDNSITGVLLLVLNISLSVACSIYADFAYKKNPGSIYVQMVQGRFTAFLASLIISVALMFYKGWTKFGLFGGPEGGWDYYVGIFIIFLIARDWVNTLTLKVLDALYKSLGGSAAVATTYIFDCLLFKNPIIPTKLFLVFAIMFAVIIYALVKNLEKSLSTYQSKNSELLEKLKQYEQQV